MTVVPNEAIVETVEVFVAVIVVDARTAMVDVVVRVIVKMAVIFHVRFLLLLLRFQHGCHVIRARFEVEDLADVVHLFCCRFGPTAWNTTLET